MVYRASEATILNPAPLLKHSVRKQRKMHLAAARRMFEMHIELVHDPARSGEPQFVILGSIRVKT